MKSRSLIILLLCSALPLLAFQSRAYKDFYSEGLEQIKAGNASQALESFKEAYRQEEKPGSYRAEGAFFVNYTPAYQIALCYEALGGVENTMEALTWAEKSMAAHESDAIRRKKDEATYHADLERIKKAAESVVAERRKAYDLGLTQAQDLLRRNKFDDAKTAFEKLYAMDASRPEGQLGIQQVSMQKDLYLKGKVVEVRSALAAEDLDKAAAILSQIQTMDPSFGDIAVLQGEIQSTKNRIEAAKVAQATPKAQPQQPKPQATVAKGPTPEEREAQRRREEARRRNALKTQVRDVLVAALKPYRRGEPSAATKALEEAGVNGIEDFASYHWLRGLFLLAEHRQSLNPDENLLTEARKSLRKTIDMQPSFQPDGDIYPQYVLTFFQDVKNSAN